MMYYISVSPIKKVDGVWRMDAVSLIHEELSCPITAKASAFAKRSKGFGVILRPRFNEPHLGLRGFREWRSFDGELFSEIHWIVDVDGWSIKTPVQVRLDSEIMVPQPPIQAA